MGLLRKAGLAGLGRPQEPAEEPSPKGSAGLLHRSLAVLRATLPPPVPAPHVQDLDLRALLQPDAPLVGEALAAEAFEPTRAEAPAGAPVALVDEPASPSPSAASPAEPLPAAVAPADILERLRALPDHVELPSHIFTVLKESLGISRGALLLYDPVRMVYAPWASCGLDQTSLRKLRISLGAVSSFNALANGAPIPVEGAASLAEYQRYFSSREFSTLSRLVLAPFIVEEKLIGALMVIETAPPFDEQARLLNCLEQISGATAPAIRRARRESRRAETAPLPRTGSSIEEEIGRLVSSRRSGDGRLLFFSISLAAYQRRILEAHRYLDPFRLEEDLRHFLEAFAADLGGAFPLPGGVFLLALQAVEKRNLDLLVHQLASYLSALFGAYDGQAAEITVLRSRMYPDDGSDISGLLSFFTS